jgi:hypothetical protein
MTGCARYPSRATIGANRRILFMTEPPSLVMRRKPQARPPSRAVPNNEPFGAGSYVRYDPSAYRITVQSHGAPGNTGHKRASAVAEVIDNFMLERGIEKSSVKYLYLQSCWARSGGVFSQAAALANITGFKVYSVGGKYSEQRRGEMKVTEPNRFELVRALSKTGNLVMFGVTQAALAARSRLRGLAGAAARRPAQSSRPITRGMTSTATD